MEENNHKTYEGELTGETEWNDLFYLCLRKWYWFIASLIVALLGATLIYLCSTPFYDRFATIMIKDEQGSSSSNTVERQLTQLGIAQRANVSNEIIALQSPALMFEVMKRLDLNTNYVAKGFFYDKSLYGSQLPIRVKFLSLSEKEGAMLTISHLTNGQFTLTGFRSNRTHSNDEEKEIKGNLNQVVNTPVGKVLVQPTKHFFPFEKPIFVTHLPLQQSCMPRVNIALTDRDATMLDLSIRDASPERGDDILNTLLDVYNESWLQEKNQVAVNTSKFIDERLRVIEQELGNVEKNITSYKSEHLLPDADAASNIYVQKRSVNSDKLLELSNQLYMATYVSDLVAKNKHRYQLLPANTVGNLPSLEAMIANYNKDLLQRNRLVMNTSPSTPIVIELEERIEQQRLTIAGSLDNLLLNLRTQKKSLERQEGLFTSQLAKAPAKATHLAAIGREQKVKESLYIFLLQKREENELSLSFTDPSFRIITPPMGSNRPSSPVKRNIYLIAFVLGLGIPFLIFYVRERFNGRVRGRKDVDHLTIPVVGEIPRLKTSKDTLWSNIKLYFGVIGGRTTTDYEELAVKAQSTNEINEAFRLVRTNFEFKSQRYGKGVVTMVTSANISSGKTFVSLNLAASLVLKKMKVIVIDLDLRKAETSGFVGSPNLGFSSYLNGQCELSEVIYDYKDSGLHIIPVGVIPPNPTELLHSERLAEALEELKQKYDYIFLDCPPTEIVADASIVSVHAAQTLFVVRAHLLLKSLLPDVERYYRTQHYPNMMMVLNGIDTNKMSYGYHRYGRYGYGYMRD